jgi:GTPase SAR1 family protein
MLHPAAAPSSHCIIASCLNLCAVRTFANFLHTGTFVEEGPTVGLNVKVVKKGGVTMKVWDLGGQAKYRSEWGRYTKGSDVIVFIVDTQAPNELPLAKKELHQLLEDRDLARLPLLVLANKIDLVPKFTEAELIKGLNLDYITTQTSVYSRRQPRLVMRNGCTIAFSDCPFLLTTSALLRRWMVLAVSSKHGTHIDKALEFLTKQSRG